jgi:hypothetical protein
LSQCASLVHATQVRSFTRQYGASARLAQSRSTLQPSFFGRQEFVRMSQTDEPSLEHCRLEMQATQSWVGA